MSPNAVYRLFPLAENDTAGEQSTRRSPAWPKSSSEPRCCIISFLSHDGRNVVENMNFSSARTPPEEAKLDAIYVPTNDAVNMSAFFGLALLCSHTFGS
jgi:hypothetical protein